MLARALALALELAINIYLVTIKVGWAFWNNHYNPAKNIEPKSAGLFGIITTTQLNFLNLNQISARIKAQILNLNQNKN